MVLLEAEYSHVPLIYASHVALVVTSSDIKDLENDFARDGLFKHHGM